MLNGVVQPVNDAANERSSQILQPYQSLWLAHWKRTRCDAAGDTTSPSASQSEELDDITRKDDLTKRVEVSSRSANGVGLTKTRKYEIGNNFMNIGRKSVGNNRTISSRDGRDADALFRLNPLKESFVESSSHNLIEFYEKNKGKAVVSASETDLLCERKVGSPVLSVISSEECLRESISCDHCLSMINQAWFLKMQKCSGIGLSPSQSNSSEENETTKSHIDCYSTLKLQKCGHCLGTMRNCTDMDVPGGERAGFQRFSQKIFDLLITKKTDVNAFKERDIFRSKSGITKFNGDLYSILPFFGQNKQLQASLDVKASMVTIRNESSTETDTTETDYFKEMKYKKNLHSASNMESNDTVSSRKVGQPQLNNKLLDINLELPNADAGNRWVKRLKLSSSNSSSIQGATSPNYASSTPRERTSKLFNGIPRSSTTRSLPDPRKHRVERSVVTDKSEGFTKIDEGNHFTKNPNDKAKALLLSHAWIQRWRHSAGRETKRESGIKAICDPISSKLAVEKLEKEQVPGIAAMALMAKVLTCGQQCELQKKGSYTIWNTKTV